MAALVLKLYCHTDQNHEYAYPGFFAAFEYTLQLHSATGDTVTSVLSRSSSRENWYHYWALPIVVDATGRNSYSGS
eukprot:475897-Rhodomonas_salina.2